ncbi:H(+)-transporting V0 sector ATPase subunit e [Ciborinia camelliae]|nr:H(+)-transporting V0 sector ATPase subunit e [Ciborinia camelliae]
MANGWSIIIGLIIVVLASVAAWFLSPKGETQTIWRSSLILSDYVLGTMASTYRTQKGRLETRVCETYELSGCSKAYKLMMADRRKKGEMYYSALSGWVQLLIEK